MDDLTFVMFHVHSLSTSKRFIKYILIKLHSRENKV